MGEYSFGMILGMPEQLNLNQRLQGYRDAFAATPQIVINFVDIRGDPRMAFDSTRELPRTSTPTRSRSCRGRLPRSLRRDRAPPAWYARLCCRHNWRAKDRTLDREVMTLEIDVAPGKSTLSYANQHRPAKLYEELFYTALARFRDDGPEILQSSSGFVTGSDFSMT